MAVDPRQYVHREPPRWQFVVYINGTPAHVFEEHRVVSGEARLNLQKDDVVEIKVRPCLRWGLQQPIHIMPGSTVCLEKVRQFR